MSDFVCGANEPASTSPGVNWGRDLPEPMQVADMRNVVAGDPSPDGKGRLAHPARHRGRPYLPAAHQVFEAMKATCWTNPGIAAPGDGLLRHRRVAHRRRRDRAESRRARHHLAERSDAVREAADRLHDALEAAGVEVLLDDRGDGVMFADLELLGIPWRVTIGDRGLKEGKAEVQARGADKPEPVELQKLQDHLKSLVCTGT
jgi:prolyl-tRNA synthetase